MPFCHVCFVFAACFLGPSTFWRDIREVPETLRPLADELQTLVLADKAPSTVKNYWAAFRRWASWAQTFDFQVLPAKPAAVALYLVYLLQTRRSNSPVIQARSALHWVHCKADVDDPTAHPTVQQLGDSIRRVCAKPVQRCVALSPQQLQEVLACLQLKDTLASKQNAALFALGFSALLRWDDLSHLLANDLEFFPSHMLVRLRQRKNDQFREGQQVVVSRFERPEYCPVRQVQRFLDAGGHLPTDPVFRRVISAPKSGSYLTGKMSYTRARELVHECLELSGQDPAGFGTHSLRSGGVTAAAKVGIADRLLQRHGGWKSPTSHHCYIEEDLDNLLSVSRGVFTLLST